MNRSWAPPQPFLCVNRHSRALVAFIRNGRAWRETAAFAFTFRPLSLQAFHEHNLFALALPHFVHGRTSAIHISGCGRRMPTLCNRENALIFRVAVLRAPSFGKKTVQICRGGYSKAFFEGTAELVNILISDQLGHLSHGTFLPQIVRREVKAVGKMRAFDQQRRILPEGLDELRG